MAEAAQQPCRGERRAAARAHNEEEGRRTRQRLDDVEVRIDGMQSCLDQHDMRLGFLEAHIKVVIRGFDAVPDFLGPATMTSGWQSLPSLQLLWLS